jgi:signal transduction histidine kinase
VAAEDVPLMFEPFRRLEATRTRGVGGSGLGLTLVRAIARTHGARLDVVPEPDGGLDVRVGLPAAVSG